MYAFIAWEPDIMPREPLIKSKCRTNSMSLRDLKGPSEISNT